MVDHCVTIEDRNERTRCAYAIIDAMVRLMQVPTNPEARAKLWDHLAIMSDFQLDIDWPVEVVRPDSLNSRPEPMHYTAENFKYRHYGKYLCHMIEEASHFPEGPEREALVLMLANQMKKLMLAVNPDGVDDDRVFRDLAELSHGAIRLSSQTTRLHEFQEAPAPVSGKKKKKKK